MTKDDKIDFIRILNDAGAFLITKSVSVSARSYVFPNSRSTVT